MSSKWRDSLDGLRVASRALSPPPATLAKIFDNDGAQPALGQALRQARLSAGHSLADVAKATGISRSFLSIVEKGESEIAFGRLIRLLRFYGISLDDAVPAARPPRLIVAPEERRELPSPGPGIKLWLLTNDLRGPMMPVLGFHDPGSRSHPLGGHQGDSFVFMLEGTLVFEREGYDPFLLQEGHSACFPGEPPFVVTNPGDQVAIVLGVVSPPSI